MSIGIYAIVNKVNGKRYVGKSINIEQRWTSHLSQLRCIKRSKDCNRYLYSSFKKYGESNFGFEYLELFDEPNEIQLSNRELHWMLELKSLSRDNGYNLRKDVGTKCIVSEDTKELQRQIFSGENNPNYGNKWTDEQKARASETAKRLHLEGRYSSDETKLKQSIAASEKWKDENLKAQMAENVSISRTTFKIAQYDKQGNLIKIWDRMRLLLKDNPTYFPIAIYNCMNGYKKSYRGFLWKKITEDIVS